MKVLLAADPPAGKSSRKPLLRARPLTVRTKPFSFSLLLTWMLSTLGAAGLIYWIASDRFREFRLLGAVELSGLEIGVLVFAVGALCWLVTQCWKYFDPFPEVRISPGAAPLGTSFDVEWTFCGSKRRLRSVSMALEGREEVWAENKSGNHSRRQKLTAPFYIEELELPERVANGQVHVQLPEGLMPTLEGEKTKIVWLVRFENQIKWGDKTRYEFPVQVLPEVADG